MRRRLSGEQLGNYQLLRLLGSGGFAEVYLGRHIYLNNQAALKVLQIILNDEDIERFAQEARTLASLNHPNIVRVLDFAVEDGTPFLVMEYAASGTLRHRHSKGSRLPTELVTSYVRQVASALQYAHDQQLIHRDVKPENMLLGASGEVLLSDFGLALLATHNVDPNTQVMEPSQAGTTPYAAPEQLQGKPEAASDQYALGVVVYEWLCGKRPFSGSSLEVAVQHLSLPPPPLREQLPGISSAIEETVMRALAKDPGQRFASVQEFASALERAYQYTLLPRSSFALPEQTQALQQLLKPGPMWKVPVSFTPLIGREKEVTDVCELLKRADVPLVTLAGTGGIGKTRLSYQVAREMQPHFADGVCFVHLASITESDLVIPTLAQELGIQQAGALPLLEQVKTALSSKHFLLLLDNFEQVVAAAPLIEDLLRACPRLKVVVTSREVLHLDAEHQFPVPPLDLPNLDQPSRMNMSSEVPDKAVLSNEAFARYAAIALFVQRAQVVQPTFQLTADNARTIAEICVRLDGLPLAIELAAARIKLLSAQELLARLAQPFQVLSSASRTLPPRHQTLHNALQWSYDLLDTGEQRLFRRLPVFVGGWPLEAVETLEETLNGQESESFPLLDRLASLLDKSLLGRRKQEGQEPRLQMLLTVREYALELLRASGEVERCQHAHALYFLRFVEEAEPHLRGPQQRTWIARLEREQENVRAALGWLMKQGEGELALRLCGALGWFWFLRGYWSEGRRWLEGALGGVAQAGRQKSTAARAKALHAAGNLAYYQNDYSTARTFLEESVDIYRTLESQKDYAYALGTLGVILHVQEALEAACRMLEDSEHLCRALNSKWELAYLLRKRAYVASEQGELARAGAYAQEGLLLAREVGDASLIATTLATLGDIAAAAGDLAQAAAYDQEALALARELGNKSLIAIAVQNLGYLAALQGNLGQTLVRAQEGLALARELGDKSLITSTLHTLGYLAVLRDDIPQAAAYYREGLPVAREIGYHKYSGLHLVGLARVAAAEGTPKRAARLFGAAGRLLDTAVDMNATERAEYERVMESVRAALGERTFMAAWAHGRTMTPEQALITPEQAEVPPGTSLPATPVYPAGLTRREVEVLRLIAQGLTVAQMAERLVISPRTVDTHITSIYRKLEVKTRGAAVRYAIEHELI